MVDRTTISSEGRPLPDQVTMGLLAYLTAHTVDEDYAEVAARKPPDARTGRQGRRVGAAGAAAIAVFAVLAVTAAAQTSQDSVSQERERRALITQVKERKAAVEVNRRTIARLRVETNRLEAQLLRNTHDSGGVIAERNLLALRSGTEAVHGTGVEIVVDDAEGAESDRNRVLDSDLQKLVNGLWEAGAEAISINGERLTNLSAIRHAGSAITVNFTSLSRPYRILAIGDTKTLPARFADTSSGQAWLDLQREVGLRFTMRTEGSLRLPAADVPVLRFAEPPENRLEKKSS
ncbi:MAG TPA: DUF881 domain-containing protein [Marmoricola sp.]|jgi:uncharacterized protein YlxW (UPF0749 family)|nr:DUF881 domain-containing protein [Marmoricola sp.]